MWLNKFPVEVHEGPKTARLLMWAWKIHLIQIWNWHFFILISDSIENV